MMTETMRDEILAVLDEGKAIDVRALDVRSLTDFTDYMIIATGTSTRHVQSLSDKLRVRLRELGVRPVGSEGEKVGDWVLIDFGDVVVHLMRPAVRDFYNLEKLWGSSAAVGAEQ